MSISTLCCEGASILLSLEKQMLFLISSTEGIDVKRLVEIYEARGISHQVVRNALTRLKKDGYVQLPMRSKYTITKQGLDFVTTINQKSLLLDKRWDGQWLTVMFEIPESERKKRDSFRNDLLQFGFGGLYKSVYVTPWDFAEQALRFAEYYGLTNLVTLWRGTFVHCPPSQLQSRQLWPLDALNDVYRTKLEWFRSKFVPMTVHLFEVPVDDLTLFVRFLELGELLADLSLNDPMLPEELLEENWLGRSCFREMQQYLRQLADAIPAHSPYRAFVSPFLQK